MSNKLTFQKEYKTIGASFYREVSFYHKSPLRFMFIRYGPGETAAQLHALRPSFILVGFRIINSVLTGEREEDNCFFHQISFFIFFLLLSIDGLFWHK